MVYESDFYTNRRPYSRPTVTSYSVTGQTYHRNIPLVGHKRLVLVSPSAHSVRSRPSILIGEIDRIHHRVRPSLAYQPTEDYLNSRSAVSFDDETRSIRAQTADLLKRIHTPVPRAQRPLPLPGDIDVIALSPGWQEDYDWYPEELGQTRLRLKLQGLKRDLSELDTGAYYSHSELPIPERITSDTYINRLLGNTRNVARDINILSHIEYPSHQYNTIGRGHLACVSFAGGRPISKRRNLASDDHVKNDINVLSHYGRYRAAAAAAANPPSEPEYVPPVHRPPSKSSVTGSWKSNAPRSPKESTRSSNLTAGDDYDAAQDKKQRRRDAVEAAAAREVEEEKRRKQDVTRQEDLAKQAIVEREQELERQAREAEEAALRKQEQDRLDAEQRAKEEEERLIREEEERIAEEQRLLQEEEEKQRLAEEEAKKAKKAKKEAEKKAKEEAERLAKEEAERLAKEEEEKRLREEEEKRRQEEEKRRLEEEEKKRLEEEEKKRVEEEEKRRQEEEEQKRKEEEEARLREEEERKAQDELAKVAEAVPSEQDTEAAPAPVEESSAVEEVTAEDSAPQAEIDAAEPIVEEPAAEPESAVSPEEQAEEEEEEE